MIRTYTLSQLAGTAAGTVTSNVPIDGMLYGVHLATNAGTMTLSTVTAPAITLLAGTAAGTAWYWPRAQVCGTAGDALTFDGTYIVPDLIPIPGQYVQLASNAAGTASATLLVKQ